MQTVKQHAGATAGLFDRFVWEAAAIGMRPVPDPRVRDVTLDAELAVALEPLFEIRTSRMVWPAALHNGIEISLDRVTIDAGGCRCDFCELELELKRGRPDTLQQVVRRLDTVTPLRLGVLSKAERGEHLLRACTEGAKAESVSLDPSMPAYRAMALLTASCLRQYRLNEEVLLVRHVPEAVHQARVALRRLRSVLALFDALIDDRARAFDPPLRSLAATLGAVRDLDVLIERNPRGDVAKALAARHEATRATLDASLRSPETRALLFDLSEWMFGIGNAGLSGPATLPIVKFAAQALNRARWRLKRRAKGFLEQEATDRHRVRKAAKRLRYAHDFFASIFTHRHRRNRVRRFGRALGRLQDQLGALNDTAVARTILRSLGNAPTGETRAKREDRLVKKASHELDATLGMRRYWRQPRELLKRTSASAGTRTQA